MSRAPAAPSTLLVALVVGLFGVTACSGSVPAVSPGPAAGSAECERALAAAPATVLGLTRSALDVPGALAWGSPPVVTRCGLAEVGPTTATCLDIDGLDWVVDPDTDPMTAVSYGRSPAVEVRVPASMGREQVPAVLVDLAPVARALPRTERACIG